MKKTYILSEEQFSRLIDKVKLIESKKRDVKDSIIEEIKNGPDKKKNNIEDIKKDILKNLDI